MKFVPVDFKPFIDGPSAHHFAMVLAYSEIGVIAWHDFFLFQAQKSVPEFAVK